MAAGESDKVELKTWDDSIWEQIDALSPATNREYA